MNRFGAWLKINMSLTQSQSKKLSVIQNLIRLYAHDEEAIEKLLEGWVKLDEGTVSVFRNDFEFFIP